MNFTQAACHTLTAIGERRDEGETRVRHHDRRRVFRFGRCRRRAFRRIDQIKCHQEPSNSSTFEKGYGFIMLDTGGPDVFAHVTQLRESGIWTLEPDDRVEYQLIKGPQAGHDPADSRRGRRAAVCVFSGWIHGAWLYTARCGSGRHRAGARIAEARPCLTCIS